LRIRILHKRWSASTPACSFIDDTPPQILLASENGDSANSVAAVQKLAPIRAP